jgi:hypothetical protein
MSHAKGNGIGEHWSLRASVPWTKEEADRVAHWWTVDRLSSTEIGRRTGRTRNSIIGRINRMGLSGAKPPTYAKPKSKKSSSARLTPSRGSAEAGAAASEPAQVPSKARPPLHYYTPSTAFTGTNGERTNGDGKKDTNILAHDPQPHERKSLIDLSSKCCRFPLGSPTMFCGREKAEHSSYCEDHDRRSRFHGARG